jgi:hypothetical protein
MDESRIERALRQGPPFRTHYVPKAMSGWPEDDADGRVVVAKRKDARIAPRVVLVLAVLLLGLAIGGIALVGSIVIVGSSQSVTTTVLGTIAIAASSSNVIGGFLLTDRMLRMFRKRR